jgi:hypothetical protein
MFFNEGVSVYFDHQKKKVDTIGRRVQLLTVKTGTGKSV